MLVCPEYNCLNFLHVAGIDDGGGNEFFLVEDGHHVVRIRVYWDDLNRLHTSLCFTLFGRIGLLTLHVPAIDQRLVIELDILASEFLSKPI